MKWIASFYQRTPAWLHVVVLLLAAAALRLPALPQPWGADQAVYGYIGERILDGELPYRDLYSSTGYGIFLTNSLAMALFGRSMLAAHLLDAIFYLATVLALYGCCRSLFSHGTGLLSAALFSLVMNGSAYSYLYEDYTAFGTYWYLLQRENIQALLLLLAVWWMALGVRPRGAAWQLAAGVSIGLAVVYKFTVILFLGFGGLFILFAHLVQASSPDGDGAAPGAGGWRVRLRRIPRILLDWILITAGVIAAQIPFLVWFHRHDALKVMFEAVFKHTKIYASLSRGHVLENLFGGHGAMLAEQFALWTFALTALALILILHRRRETLLLAGWVIVSWLLVAIQKKFFGYHFILLAPPLVVLAALGIRSLLTDRSETPVPAGVAPAVRSLAWALLFLNAFVYLGSTSRYLSHQLRYMLGKMDQAAYEQVFTAYPKHMYSVPGDRAAADWIAAHKSPGDHLEIVNGGGDNLVHHLSGTVPRSRFTSTWYVLIPDLYDEPYTSGLRREFVRNIVENRPAFVLFIYFDLPEYLGADHQDIQDFLAFMQAEYVRIAEFPDARYLYVPRDRAAAGATSSTGGNAGA